MKEVLVIILSFMITTPSYSCDKPVTYLKQGEITTCEGFLFSKEKELEVRVIVEDYESLKEATKLHINRSERLQEQVILSDKELDKERQRSDLWRQRAIESTEQLLNSQSSNSWRDFGFILSGIGLTVLSGWTIGQVAK